MVNAVTLQDTLGYIGLHCSESDKLTSTINHRQCLAYFHSTAITNLQSGCLMQLASTISQAGFVSAPL